MTMVGREPELIRLVDLLDRAESGAGGFAVITGEAGIGKTRLVTEWAAFSSPPRIRRTGGSGHRRRRLLTAGCSSTDGRSTRQYAAGLRSLAAVPAGTQSSATRLLLPGFPTEETADFVIDASVVLGEGVLRLPQSVGGSGAVLLLEDLHWADPDTVALLDYLGGALTTAPAAAVPADLPFQLLSVGSEIPDPTRQLVER